MRVRPKDTPPGRSFVDTFGIRAGLGYKWLTGSPWGNYCASETQGGCH